MGFWREVAQQKLPIPNCWSLLPLSVCAIPKLESGSPSGKQPHATSGTTETLSLAARHPEITVRPRLMLLAWVLLKPMPALIYQSPKNKKNNYYAKTHSFHCHGRCRVWRFCAGCSGSSVLSLRLPLGLASLPPLRRILVLVSRLPCLASLHDCRDGSLMD